LWKAYSTSIHIFVACMLHCLLKTTLNIPWGLELKRSSVWNKTHVYLQYASPYCYAHYMWRSINSPTDCNYHHHRLRQITSSSSLTLYQYVVCYFIITPPCSQNEISAAAAASACGLCFMNYTFVKSKVFEYCSVVVS